VVVEGLAGGLVRRRHPEFLEGISDMVASNPPIGTDPEGPPVEECMVIRAEAQDVLHGVIACVLPSKRTYVRRLGDRPPGTIEALPAGLAIVLMNVPHPARYFTIADDPL